MIQTQTQSAPAAAAADANAVAGAAVASAPSHSHHLESHLSSEPHQADTAPASPVGKLKYADPRNLPSYPSSGLRPGGAVAGAAATLGRATHHQEEPVEMGRPDSAASASAAAVFAKDLRMPPMQDPATTGTPEDAGFRAAALAVESADAALKKPHDDDDDDDDDGLQSELGKTAADSAFNATHSLSQVSNNLLREGALAAQASYTDRAPLQEVDPPPTVIGDDSLAAAIGAMSFTKQAIADSPEESKTEHQDSRPVDAPTASANALKGATAAHRESMRIVPPEDPGAVSVTTMTREMFTSLPPVKPEADEVEADERLHQSAVEMARTMFQEQQQQGYGQTQGHHHSHGQVAGSSEDSSSILPNAHANLQDAAYRQAQERLAKLQDERQRQQEYRNYYSRDQLKDHVPQRRFSLMARLRGQSDDNSRADSRRRQKKTRPEIPFFSTQLSQAEEEQRERAREAVLIAAHRNVKAQLQEMDKRVARDAPARPQTAPGIETQGEPQHRTQAPVPVPAPDKKKGQIDIGGGRFMDASEIDAIAARRVRPILDDLDGSVAAERRRMDTLRREEDHRRDELRRQKSRERERKEMDRRFREEDKQNAKARKLQAKEDAKARKEDAKVAKAERKRQVKEQKQRRKQNRAGGLGTDQFENGASGLGVARVNTDRGRNGAQEASPTIDREAVPQGRGESHQGSHRQSHQSSTRESRRSSTLDSHQGSTGNSQQDTTRGSRLGSIADSQPAGPYGASNQSSNPGSSKGPSSPISRVTGWFKSRLSKNKASDKEGSQGRRQKGFIGGAALRDSGDQDTGSAAAASQEPSRRGREASPRRETLHEDFEAPRQLANTSTEQVSSSPARDSRFREIIDQ